MNYSLFAASKLLQKRGEWDKVAELFSGFVKDKPDNPTVVSAIYWIGKARAHEGKIDEAKQLTADTIKKYIADPSRDAVEQLITQLAQLCVKKKRPGEIGRRPARSGLGGARLQSSRAQNSTACFPRPPTKIQPPPRRAFSLPKRNSRASADNRLRKRKTSRRSRTSLSRRT